MTKHVHAEMIKAKADNMELVKFIKVNGEWIVDNLGSCHFDDMCEYFLCLPQHKEACLHWLNGGQIECKDIDSDNWFSLDCAENWKWSSLNNTMSEKYEIRIKPRKEKRWIAVRNEDKMVSTIAYESLSDALDDVSHDYWQFIEIEIEI